METITLFTFILLGIAFALCAFFISSILRYCAFSNEKKNCTYECGNAPKEDAVVHFEPKFLVFAIVFLLFEAETILLFPYALCVDKLGIFGLVEVLLFVFMLLFCLVFAIKSGILRFQ